MFKPDNKVFEERREIFLNKLGGKAAIIPGANLVKHHESIMLIVNILLDKIVIFGI